MGYSPCGRTESDTTEHTYSHTDCAVLVNRLWLAQPYTHSRVPALSRAHSHTRTHLPHLLSMGLSLSWCLRNQHVGLARVAMSPRQPLRKDELKCPLVAPGSSLGIWSEMTLQREFTRPEVQPPCNLGG